MAAARCAEAQAVVEDAARVAVQARDRAGVVDEVEVAVEVDVDQLEAVVLAVRHVGRGAAIPERAVAVVEHQARAEEEVHEAVFVEIDGLAAARNVGRARRIVLDAGRRGGVVEHPVAVVDEQPVAGAIAV